jgi:hypothetical protein
MNTSRLLDIAFLPLERRKDFPQRTAATEPRPRVGIAQEGSSSPCADLGTAEVSVLYPVTCEPRYYDAASRILEDEECLAGNPHDNCNELGALIQQWIEKARDNWEPR